MKAVKFANLEWDTQILDSVEACTCKNVRHTFGNHNCRFRLAHFFGTSAKFWLNLQSLYELRVATGEGGQIH